MSTPSNPRRVVVTGIGCLTSLGPDTAIFWDSLLKGRSGISRVTRFDPTDFPSKVGAEIRDFDPGKFMDPKEAKRNDRYTQYAVAASRMAVEDAKLDVNKIDSERFENATTNLVFDGVVSEQTQMSWTTSRCNSW